MTAHRAENKASISYHIEPGGCLQGSLRVPGDKSISHRAVILGAIAEGVTEVSGLLPGADVLATLAAFRAMGVKVHGPDMVGGLRIDGVGLHGLRPSSGPLDMGNSGTAMRLLTGLLAGQSFDSTLIGDASLSRRPMERVAGPLNAMGAQVVCKAGGYPPVTITGGRRLQGIDYILPVPSAQIKSALLLAGLYARGATSITEPAPTRDHTERMLHAFGYPVEQGANKITVRGGGRLTACRLEVPGDLSSAAFFLVAASVAPGSELRLEGVGVNPTRTGVLNILMLMGADLQRQNERLMGGEPVADIIVRSAPLRGVRVPEDQVPLAIDEFPALFIAAACAHGDTVLSGARELRLKESDRIAVMAAGLARLGVDVREAPDGIVIRGGELQGGAVDSHGDHRVAMAFAVAGLRARGPLRVRDCGNVATSFPGFVELASRAGLGIREINGGG